MRSRAKGGRVAEHISYTFIPNHQVTMEALAHAVFTNQEFRLIISLLNLTNGYLREEAKVSLSFWGGLTGMSRQHVWHAVHSLIDDQVIKRNGKLYSVNPPDQWKRDVLKVLPNQATKVKRGRAAPKAEMLPNQATLLPEEMLPNQATPVAQPGYNHLPNQATLSATKRPTDNNKDNTIKKTPSHRNRGVGGKPYQQEAAVFLDGIASREGITFPNRNKLMGIVRSTLVSTAATVDDITEWYAWVKANDEYWKGKEAPVIIGRMPEKFPTWLRDRQKGELNEPGPGIPERGGHNAPEWPEGFIVKRFDEEGNDEDAD